jgi:hypothetical protein
MAIKSRLVCSCSMTSVRVKRRLYSELDNIPHSLPNAHNNLVSKLNALYDKPTQHSGEPERVAAPTDNTESDSRHGELLIEHLEAIGEGQNVSLTLFSH